MLKAVANEETDLLDVTSDLTGDKMSFRRIVGSVWFGSPDQTDPDFKVHAAVVGGEQLDGRFNMLREVQRELWDDFVLDLISCKDCLIPAFMYAPEGALQRKLALQDGLTHYRIKAVDIRGRPVYAEQFPEQAWSDFRNWSTKTMILPLPVEQLGDFRAWHSRVEGMNESGQVLAGPNWTPGICGTEQIPRSLVGKAPIFRAYVNCVAMLEIWKQAAKATGEAQPADPWPKHWRGFHG